MRSTFISKFRAIAKDNPDKIAIVDSENTMTFSQLDRLSNALANKLNDLGSSYSIIGVCLDISVEFVVAILAILKVGKTFVPIKIGKRGRFLREIIADASIGYVITSSHLKLDISGIECLEIDRCILDDGRVPDIDSRLQTAFIDYTKAIQGRVLGVVISFKALNSYVLNSFDSFLPESPCYHLFKTLDSVHRFIPDLLRLLIKLEPILLNSCPENAQVKPYFDKHNIDNLCMWISIPLTDEKRRSIKEDCADFRVRDFIISTNDILCKDLYFIETLLNQQRMTIVQHLPEVTGQYLILHKLDQQQWVEQTDKNTSSIVVDGKFNKVQKGEFGELIIGGSRAADGYLNNPSITKERFFKLANGSDTKKTFFCTNECASSGNIVVQNKTRKKQAFIDGYLVDFQYIEDLVNTHGDIKACQIAYNDKTGTLQLYFVPDEFVPSREELRAYLGEAVSGPLIPDEYTSVEELPAIIDQDSLGGVPLSFEGSKEEKSQETLAIEEQLCSLWKEVLHLPTIEKEDNFFELGGDSITCILLIGKAKSLGIGISLLSIYDHPTIEDLAPHCQLLVKSSTFSSEKSTKFLPLSPIQNWFFSQNFSDFNYYNQSAVIQMKSSENRNNKELINTLLSTHEAFFISFSRDDGQWSQVKNSSLMVEYSTHHLDSKVNFEEEISRIANQAQKEIDIVKGPLTRIYFFHGEDQSYILFILHHLIVDWVSWGILFRDLDALIEDPPTHSILNQSYSRWLNGLGEYAVSSRFDKDSKYWDQNKCVIELKWSAQPYTKKVEMKIHEGYVLLLESALQNNEYELLDVLIAAFSLAISSVFEISEFSVDLEGHGRCDLQELKDSLYAIGWLTSLFPVDLNLIDPKKPLEALRSVKKQRGMILNGGIAFGIKNFQKGQSSINFLSPFFFNYLGKESHGKNKNFERCSFPLIQDVSSQNALPYLLGVNAMIQENDLVHRWIFSPRNISQEKIVKLGEAFEKYFIQIAKKLNHENQHIQTTKALNISKQYPLTSLQLGLYFAFFANKQNEQYIIQNVFELPKNTRLDLLKCAWEHALETFEVLRNRFIMVEGEPLQQTFDHVNLDWQEENQEPLSLKPTPFELEKPSLMRLRFYKTEDFIYLTWTIHHLITDGWSSALVLRYVENTYYLLSKGKEPSNVARKQLSDFVDWEKKQDQEGIKKFWIKALDRAVPTYLSRYFPPLAEGGSHEVLTHNMIVERELSMELRALAKDYGVTLNAIFQATWALLLSKIMKQSHVTFGVTVSGRAVEMDCIDEVAGLLINTLPFPVEINSKLSFQKLCKEVHRASVEAQLNGSFSLNEIMRLVDTQGEQHLFDHIFVFENFPMSSEDQLMKRSKKYCVEVKTGYPLTIVVLPEKTIRIELSYDTAYFDGMRIKSFVDQFNHLLTSICDHKNLSLGDIKLENHKVVSKNWRLFNETMYLPIPTLSEMIKGIPWHESTSALIEGDRVYTYKELNRQSMILLGALQDYKDCKVVGILLKRSIEFLVAVVSCVRGGITFVPMDPDAPRSRLDFLIKDSQCDVVVFQNPEKVKCSVPMIDIDQLGDHKGSVVNAIEQSQTAYIIYTSGSTGKPKGVKITRKSLANYLAWGLAHYVEKGREGSILHSSVVFDMAITSIFIPLLSGQTLYIVPKNEDIDGLIRLLKKGHLFSFIKMTPSHLKILNAEGITKSIRYHVAHLVLGGEALVWQDLSDLKGANTIEIFNEYGPTETTVGCCVYKADEKSGLDKKGICPIGQPIFNMALYLFNEEEEVCRMYEKGEIYISGLGLAEGYTQKDETDAFFFVKQCPDGKKRRMYKTGDIAYMDGDRNLIYLGREDRQIKIKGYRIELHEIEEALNSHGDVTRAVVDFSPEGQLHGYYTAEEFSPSEDELIQFLSEKLPRYMLPNQLFPVPTIPITKNGKIDWTQLRNYHTRNGLTRKKELPTTRLESEIYVLWIELLKNPSVGVNDHFFQCGGDSLLALRMLGEITRQLGREVSLGTFLVNPTIRYLGAQLEKTYPNQDYPIWISKKRKKANGSLILIHPGGGLSYVYSRLMNALELTQYEILALNDPYFGKESPFETIDEMADHYFGLIKKKKLVAPISFAGWSFGGNVAYELVKRFETLTDIQIGVLFLFDSYNYSTIQLSKNLTDDQIKENINTHLNKKNIDLNSSYSRDLKHEMLRNRRLAQLHNPQAIHSEIVLVQSTSEEDEGKRFENNGWKKEILRLTTKKVDCDHSDMFDPEFVSDIIEIVTYHLKNQTPEKVSSI